MNITIAGAGYVDLVTGVCLASKGHDMVCVDVSGGRIAALQSGKAPFFELGLETMLKAHQGRLSYTTDGMAGYRGSDVIFICVGTPERRDGSANLQYVYEAAAQIASSIERIVIGSRDGFACKQMLQVYDGFQGEKVSQTAGARR